MKKDTLMQFYMDETMVRDFAWDKLGDVLSALGHRRTNMQIQMAVVEVAGSHVPGLAVSIGFIKDEGKK